MLLFFMCFVSIFPNKVSILFLCKVHFSFTDAGPVFHMPPPCSVVIQVRTNELLACACYVYFQNFDENFMCIYLLIFYTFTI